MLAAERGAAANTLAAYRRDLEGAAEVLGDLTGATRGDLEKLGAAWSGLAPASLARKGSALRQFYGFPRLLKLSSLAPLPRLSARARLPAGAPRSR